jgi:hypothetical protein
VIEYVAAAEAPAWASGWVALIVGVLGATGLLASAAAYFRASYAKATVATLAESNAALSEQVRILKEERDEDRKEREDERREASQKNAAMAIRVEALERENGVLREVVQGKADVERLVMLIQDHHHEVIEDRKAFHIEWRGEIDKMQGTLDDVLSATGEIATSQKAVRGMVGKVYAATVGDRT